MKSQTALEIKKFFSTNKDKQGSKKRLKNLIKSIPENHLIAGSWAIEISTEKRFQHTDIDVICLDEEAMYIDDSMSREEKCEGIIPINTSFFENTKIKKKIFDKKVFVPCFEFQTAAKIFGELDLEYPSKAKLQLFSLFDPINDLNEKDLEYIYQSTLPEFLNHKWLANKTKLIFSLYKSGEGDESEKVLEEIHQIINTALHIEFKKL